MNKNILITILSSIFASIVSWCITTTYDYYHPKIQIVNVSNLEIFKEQTNKLNEIDKDIKKFENKTVYYENIDKLEKTSFRLPKNTQGYIEVNLENIKNSTYPPQMTQYLEFQF